MAVPAFRVDVQGAVKDIAIVMECVAGQASGGKGVSSGVTLKTYTPCRREEMMLTTASTACCGT